MHLGKVALFCWVVICSQIVALADKEDRSGEVLDEREISADNETSVEAGPPDSHEAMNNREMGPKAREKRSYEFLMGLINNNSRYEVTKVDPSAVTEKPKAAVENAAAGELLLELMVRIASHPDQWDKVHKLLQNIDRDLMTSRNVVSSLKSNSPPSGRVQNRGDDDEYNVNKEVVPGVSGGSTPIGVDQRKETWNERGSDTKHFDATREKESKWPTFEDEAQDNEYVKFVNNTSAVSTNHTARNDVQKDSWQMQNRSAKSTYPKNFSYHRVTGKPIYLNKNPTAYIAVSVIAPKQINVRSKDEDVTLERQLHQLKPWTRSQNLENTADVRSRWAKRRDEFKTKPIPPTL